MSFCWGFHVTLTWKQRQVSMWRGKTGCVIYCDLSPQSQFLPMVQLEASSCSSCSSLRFKTILVPSQVKRADGIQVLGFFFACTEEFERVKQKQLYIFINVHFNISGTFITRNLYPNKEKSYTFKLLKMYSNLKGFIFPGNSTGKVSWFVFPPNPRLIKVPGVEKGAIDTRVPCVLRGISQSSQKTTKVSTKTWRITLRILLRLSLSSK